MDALQRMLDILSLRTRGIRAAWLSDERVELSSTDGGGVLMVMSAGEVSDFVAWLRGDG